MTKNNRKEIEEWYIEQAKQIVYYHWGVELTCPIEFVNRKWKRMNACFIVYTETGECKIRLNHRRHDELGFGGYLPILKHELAHWYLWSIGEPFRDEDERFVHECVRIGASISETKSAQKAFNSYWNKEAVGH